jgi:predicted nucleic acid-binding protein
MEPRFVFIDSGPFVIDLALPQDPRAGLTRRFLERVQTSRKGVTALVAVLEVAGAVSFHSTVKETTQLARRFGDLFGVRVWPETRRLSFEADDVTARLARRMKLGDALMLTAAETCRPRAATFVTWNPADFRGRTALNVVTPQQFMRG